MTIIDNLTRAFHRRKGAVPALAAVLIMAACFAQAAQDTGAIVRERCHECHELAKTCLVETDDAQWWHETVLRMVEYKSELLTADEAAAVSVFLADKGKRASVCTPQ